MQPLVPGPRMICIGLQLNKNFELTDNERDRHVNTEWVFINSARKGRIGWTIDAREGLPNAPHYTSTKCYTISAVARYILLEIQWGSHPTFDFKARD